MKHDPAEVAFMAFLKDAIGPIKERLHLDEWTIKFVRVKRVPPHKHLPDNEGDGYSFEVETDHVYMDVVVQVSDVVRDLFRNGELKRIRELLHHELAHVWTDPVYDFLMKKARNKKEEAEAINIVENLTERIAQLSFR
jgi:hypothetical protein